MASAAGATLGLAAPALAVGAASVTVSPLRGTPAALPQTQISFLGAPAKALSSVSVVGSATGAHSGRLRSYSSAPGASFVPSKPFTPGERVTVHARLALPRHRHRRLSDTFTIAQPATLPTDALPSTPGTPADVQSFHSLPDVHPAKITVNQPASAGSAPGYIFAAPFLGPGQYGPMIFDDAGELVWFDPLRAGEHAADFRTQLFRSKNVLTWWQGRTNAFGYGLGEDVVANANYKVIAVIRAGNGLQADEHEFTLTPRGSAYALAYSPIQTSLAPAGGPASGIVLDGVIQLLDPHTGLVMWEWHSVGHVALSESYSTPPGPATSPFDYFHINSLTAERHGNLLISARNTWALYQLSGRSGAVLWRLGGKRSSFALGAGVQFAYQHDAKWTPGGEISLFDDEGDPPIKPPSRGELIKLDLKARTATLTKAFVRTSGPLTTTSEGNMQPLRGGGWMIGWGALPNLTEFNSRGEAVYDAQLPAGENSYRIYREAWSAQPATPPAILARSGGSTSTVYASWNGATTVFSWELLTGATKAHLSVSSTTPRSGFETTIPAPAAAFYQVRALSASGRVLAGSAIVAPAAG